MQRCRNNHACQWKNSLHGGHSSDFCDHAHNTLQEILDAAVATGYHIFGVTEHAPRVEDQYLYEEERAMGWDVVFLDRMFRRYALTLDRYILEYEDRLQVLKGFEIEVVPPATYAQVMLSYKKELKFDYVVGSVHYVDGWIIDYIPHYFELALESCGGYEALAVKYFQTVSEMVDLIKPEVIGHFDLIRKNFPKNFFWELPRVLDSAKMALEVIKQSDAIMDINTAAYRTGMTHPYPAPIFLNIIREMDIPVCFGDDSHATSQVGYGLNHARTYLLQHGITTITVLKRGEHGLTRDTVSLMD